jgi:NAD(P)-dependent dehydrogenase (short-subunit alcohol dehydrogenase family)
MKAGFSLHYRIVELEQDKRMLMTVNSKLFTAREEILFGTTKTGTTVRYIANFNFPSPLAAANRIYPAAMDKVGKSTMEGLQAALEDNFEPPEASRSLALADRLVLPGIWRFTRLGYQSSRKRWKPVSAYLEGRHALVTGATSGVGLAAAKELASLGATVTLVARNEIKARKTAKQLQQHTGNSNIGIEIADMSLMTDVHALCDRLLAAGKPVDMLINNAGALFNPRQQTAEGLEKSFALLLLGPYILTERLHPLLVKSDSPRVVNVSSGGMYSQKIHVNDLQSQKGSYSGSVAYARAKRGLMILTGEWAKRWDDDGIAVNAMHPGWADTPGVETSLPGFYKVTRRFLRSPEEGADTIVWLAASTEAATRETADERSTLLEILAEMLESTRPAAKRGRRKSSA